MRIRTLFMSMVAGLAFVGCSNEEDMTSGNNGEPQYLTVSVNATSTLTRANSLEGDYEEGVGNENEVTNVRFYFFDADGNAARVKGESGGTYYDVAMSGTDKDMDNVEKILTATLVIQTPAKDKVPASIVAVVNPKSDLVAVESIAKLNEVIADHSSTTSFIMSSSVYANETTKMEAVNVAGHLYPTADAAEADPVIIHVERVLAKARLTVDLTAYANGVYKTSDDGSQKFGDEEIYVKFLGWNVTATANTSRLMKEINPSWPSNLFGSTLWNTADYYRSFWAVNPSEMSYNYGAFNTGDNAANAITNFDPGTKESPKTNYTYLQENASDDKTKGTDPEKPSQVIIAAQLVKEDGSTAIEFAEYAGERTTINGLIVKYAAASELWKDNEEGTGRVKIGVDDIELKTATEINAANQNTSGRYKVYAQLTADAAKKTWYTSKEADASPVDNANDILKALGGAKVWNDGYTYYYFDIQHLNGGASAENVKGKIGVVRNHIYAANINSLAGLGTPVYDPEEIIYPEHPEEDETFIAAQIRILSWRVVNQGINLKW